jgi:hypothetical protein
MGNGTNVTVMLLNIPRLLIGESQFLSWAIEYQSNDHEK